MENVMDAGRTAAAAPPPAIWTRHKLGVISLLWFGWYIGCVDRTIIYFAAPFMIREFHLTATQMGIIMSAFFAGYALMQVPGGVLADRFGPRKVFLWVVFVWSLFTGVTGLTYGFAAMVLVRFLFGLSEAPYQMAAGKTIAMTFHRSERGKAASIMLSSAGFVAFVGPMLAAVLIGSFSWRFPFIATAVFGVVIIALFYLYMKPRNDYAYETQAVAASEQAIDSFSYRKVFSIPMIWSLVLAAFASYTLVWGMGSWMPTYFMKTLGLNIAKTGIWQTWPGLGILVGLLGSGFIIDRLSDRQNKLVAILCAALSTLALYLLFRGGIGIKAIVAIQTFVNLAMGFVQIYMPVLLYKKIPVNYLGRTNGIINAAAQFGAFFAPLSMGLITDLSGGRLGASFIYLVVTGAITTVAFLTLRTDVERYVTRQV
jgi:sugar phosphate permease